MKALVGFRSVSRQRAPRLKTFVWHDHFIMMEKKIEFKNALGMKLTRFEWEFARKYGGSYNGVGKYVTQAGVQVKDAYAYTLGTPRRDNDNDMTMAHSEKSHNRRMKAWPYRGHDPTKKNLFC